MDRETDSELGRLMKEASIHGKQAGEKGISAKSIRRVTEVSSNLAVLGDLLYSHPLLGNIAKVQRIITNESRILLA